jgi:predicted TIM-barrel fold metal-dependent hydrolase
MDQNTSFLHRPTRRELLTGAAVVGLGTLLSGRRLGGQAAAGDKPRLVNVHHHLTAPAYAKFLSDNKLRDFPNKSATQSIEDLDQAGITMAFTSIIGPGIWFGNVADTRKMARECNDYAAKLITDYPGRFGMFTMLPLPDIDGSLREIEYGFETLKADGVYMFTNWGGKALYGDKYLGDPMLAPIYEELNRRKAVIYTHPKDAACCHDILPGTNGATIEYPMDTARSIYSLLTTGTAAKYPNLTFIFSHAGGAMPYLVERVVGPQATWLEDGGVLKPGAPAPRVRPEMPKGPLVEMQKFYYDTAGSSNPVTLGGLRKFVPLSQILFGTDYPFASSAEQLHLLKECAVFNPSELQAIYSGNAVRFLPRLSA